MSIKTYFMRAMYVMVIAALVFSVTGNAYAQEELPQFSLNIRAYIDGYSQLIIQGNNVYWHHIGAAAPGRLDTANEPTYLNGAEWFPAWPDEGENRDCNCDTDDKFILGTPLPEGKSFILNEIDVRWSTYISQQPTAENGYTLIIDFDDGPPGGADWYEVELATASFAPWLIAFPENDAVEGWEWPEGATVTLTINNTTNPDWRGVANVTTWGDPRTYVRIEFGADYNLQIGDVIELTDGINTITHTVKTLSVIDVNQDDEFIGGTAEAGEIVSVWPHGHDQEATVLATTSQDGFWQANFKDLFDLVVGTCGRSQVTDPYGNATAVDWCAPKPWFAVFPEWDVYVQAFDYPLGATVHLAIDDPATTEINPDIEADQETEVTSWNPNGAWAVFSLPPTYDTKPGDIVTLTSAGITPRVHTVQNLAITTIDADDDMIMGTADPGAEVYVWPFATWQQKQVTTNAERIWQVDFTGEFNLVPGECGRVEIRDEDRNVTALDWCVPWPPSTFIVNTTDDSDDGTCDEIHCSLREAIRIANERIVADVINFNIPGTPPFTIQPRSGYFEITDPLTIDATTQPGYEGSPVIELDGTYAGDGTAGLVISTNNSTVRGLAINRYSGNGIIVFGSGNTVRDNYIGTDVTGMTIVGPEGTPVDMPIITVMSACPAYSVGTDIDGFVSESEDPLALWSGTSVHFKGTEQGCGSPEKIGEASLIYRYKLEFANVTPLESITVSGAAFNGPDNILRVLDEDMNVLGSINTFGGNSFVSIYLRLQDVERTVFYIDEFDTSSNWRYRQNIVINGPVPLGNRGSGVLIAGGATNNQVIDNLISGNIENGVAIFNPGTTGNVVQENYIGTNVMGTQALGNGAPGVGIGDQAYNNFIIGNLISGNRSDGVAIFNPGTNGNTLEGNNIGTDVNRELAIPNGGVGVWIGEGASNTVIGGNDASTRNVISGNKWGGIGINNLETTGTRVTGNYIGTNKNGDNALPNGGDGVYISGSQSIITGNVISGNTANGVSMGWSATGNIVQNNFIGTDATGTSVIGSISGPALGEYDVEVMSETCPTYEPGTDRDGFISESDDPLAPWLGISVTFKGTDEDKCGIPDTFEDIPLIYRYKLTFAGPTELASLAVSGAAFNGSILRVLDEGMNVLGTAYNYGGNTFQTSYIRLTGVVGQVFYIEEYDYSSDWRYRQSIIINGPLPLGNLGGGVSFHDGATNNQVIGNLISGNRSDAVSLYHTNTTGNILQGNYIGTDVTGTVALPNTSAAIWIGEGASNTLIGGTEEGQGNLISGNTGDAISINNSETTGTVIQGNFIGTDATGTASIPNRSNGIVLVTGTHDNLIGGIEPGAGNTIAFNKGAGILYADAGTGNAALTNSVFSNGWLGIELGGDGVTRNDRLDQDTGPNNLQNYPIITTVTRIGTSVMIQGLLPSTPRTTFRVEFFSNETCDPSASGEGQTFLGFAVVKTNPVGLGRFETTLPVSLPPGTFVTATATDPAGNTSEFSKCFSPAPGWNLMNDSGFGDSQNVGVTALETFQDQLYASASNWNTGGQVWRLGGDGLWSQVSDPGFGGGPANPAIIDLAVFQGNLYAGTGWDNAPGQIWRSVNGINWQSVTADGFGNGDNTAITNFVVFKNMLYAGTGNTGTSAQIWRSSTGNSGSWKQVAPDGPGLAGNITGFAVYKNILYAAVEPAGGLGAPLQVWRSVDGSLWTIVTDDGFRDGSNVSTGGFAQFGGYLYLGTRNDDTGAQLWRTNDGINWAQVVNNGFGDSNNIKIESLLAFNDRLYAITYNWVGGLQVWRSANGQTWEQVGANGFGDSANSSTLWNSATVMYQGQLVIGTWNNNEGGEIWQFAP